MMQIEADKFRSAVNLTQDYYYSIEEKLIPDPPEKPYANIGQAIDDGIVPEDLPAIAIKPDTPAGQPPVDETYPWLDKIFSLAL